MTTTRVSLLQVTPPYQLETATPDMSRVTGRLLAPTDGTALISLDSGNVLLYICAPAGLAITAIFTINSYPTPFGRVADVSESIEVGDDIARIFTKTGWANSDGDLELIVSQGAIVVFPFLIQ